MSRFSSRLTRGRSSTPRTRLNITALAPIPRASVSTTVAVSAFARARERAATFSSRRKDTTPSIMQVTPLNDNLLASLSPLLSFYKPKALATSSAACACALGRRDHELTRHEALAHARMIVEATDLPVSGDLGKGFGDAPEIVAETVRLAADAGLVGCTIEDATGNQDSPLYDFRLAVERISAAAQAADALPFPFMLAARAHNFLYASPSLDDTISRL